MDLKADSKTGEEFFSSGGVAGENDFFHEEWEFGRLVVWLFSRLVV